MLVNAILLGDIPSNFRMLATVLAAVAVLLPASSPRSAHVVSRRAPRHAALSMSAYGVSAKRLGAQTTADLADYQGKVALVVNLASK